MDLKEFTIEAMQKLLEKYNLELVYYRSMPIMEEIVFANSATVLYFYYEPMDGYYTVRIGPRDAHSFDSTGKIKSRASWGYASLLDQLVKEGVEVPSTKECYTVEGIEKTINLLVSEITRRESLIFGA